MYSLLADIILIAHATFVAFVVISVPCIFLGWYLHWAWVRVLWVRVVHLVATCFVAAQAWAGVVCPLTTLEMSLREKGGLVVYSGSFVKYWLQRIIYWDLPAWMFVVAYSLFLLLVVCTWLLVPPARGQHKDSILK
ncbi:DUF2784 domain-containing protein [Haliea sp.]|uniref:DUF2784 domain-containing protein n=1 Tax=Haliea sp. TaxID=1932666 RepID=UPI0032ECA4FB